MKGNKKLWILGMDVFGDGQAFDFFLRVKDDSAAADGPLVDAAQFTYEKEFPWKFQPMSTPILIQYIQLRNQHPYVHAQAMIEEPLDRGQIQLMGIRSQKPLCCIDYQWSQELQSISKSRIESHEQKIQFSKDDHTQLTQQIATLNQTIQKLLKKQDRSEYMQFSRLSSEPSEHLSSSRLNTNERWYLKKFGKRRKYTKSPILKAIEQDDSEEQVEEHSLNYSESVNQDQPIETLLLSNFSFDTEIAEINLLQKQDSALSEAQLVAKLKCKKKGKMKWNKSVRVPFDKTLFIKAIEEESQKQLHGQLKKQKLSRPEIILYDQMGQEKAAVKFTPKLMGQCSIQTSQPLQQHQQHISSVKPETIEQQSQNEQTLEPQQKEKKLSENIKREQNDHESSQKVEYDNILTLTAEKEKKDSEKYENELEINHGGLADISQNGQSQSVYPASIDQTRLEFNRVEREEKNENQMEKEQKQEEKEKEKEDIAISTSSIREKKCTFMSNVGFAQYSPTALKVSDQKPMRDSKLSGGTHKSYFPSHRAQTFTLHITQISLKLQPNPHIPKYIKLTLPCCHHSTETHNHQHLAWKLNHAVFEKVQEHWDLMIQVLSAMDNQVLAAGRISMMLLEHQQPKHHFYHEYLRNDEEQAVGEIIIGYQCPIKRSRSFQISALKKRTKKQEEDPQEEKMQILQLKKIKTNRKTKRKTNRSGSESLSLEQFTRKGTNQTNLSRVMPFSSLHDSDIHPECLKRLQGSSTIIRKHKYTGGNIIFGKGRRFPLQKPPRHPGPGNYELPSTFQRYSQPI